MRIDLIYLTDILASRFLVTYGRRLDNDGEIFLLMYLFPARDLKQPDDQWQPVIAQADHAETSKPT